MKQKIKIKAQKALLTRIGLGVTIANIAVIGVVGVAAAAQEQPVIDVNTIDESVVEASAATADTATKDTTDLGEERPVSTETAETTIKGATDSGKERPVSTETKDTENGDEKRPVAALSAIANSPKPEPNATSETPPALVGSKEVPVVKPVENLVPIARNATIATPPCDPCEAEVSGPFGMPVTLNIGGFIDAYHQVNLNHSLSVDTVNTLRAYAIETGFNLGWAGIHVAANVGDVTGHLALRVGPTANLGYTTDVGGLEHIQEAYVSWVPVSWLTLDAGRWNTIYGAEVTATQDNYNYSRGLLFQWAQPVFHHGLRASASFLSDFTLTGIVVNGYGALPDNNASKSVGVQLGWSRGALAVVGGYLGGSEASDRNDNGEFVPEALLRLTHLVDVVVTFDTKFFGLVANADIVVEDHGEQIHYGGGIMAAAQARYSVFAASLRAEVFADPAGSRMGLAPANYGSMTLTGDFRPAESILLRAEGRVDCSTTKMFSSDFGPGYLSGTFLSSVVFVLD